MSFLEKGSNSGKSEVELSISDLEIAEMLARKEMQGNNGLGTAYTLAYLFPIIGMPLFSIIFYIWKLRLRDHIAMKCWMKCWNWDSNTAQPLFIIPQFLYSKSPWNGSPGSWLWLPKW